MPDVSPTLPACTAVRGIRNLEGVMKVLGREAEEERPMPSMAVTVTSYVVAVFRSDNVHVVSCSVANVPSADGQREVLASSFRDRV